ncbi:auxin-responsive protein IAA9-like [Vicia villosa]|uniref:auxin-responsive protein IAA9-like n=1 Tax=Vicia villosa TaxID=3911 RepID=UPI00273B5BB0|nr:auxin-responsive protein IAA9-like [Vicia villosa]
MLRQFEYLESDASATAGSLNDSICISMMLGLNDRNYLRLSDCSSVDNSGVPTLSDEKKVNLNLKATELRFGHPGSQSLERDLDLFSLSSTKLDEKQLFPLLPTLDGICSLSQKTVVSGNKRGFTNTMDVFPEVKSLSIGFPTVKGMFIHTVSDTDS